MSLKNKVIICSIFLSLASIQCIAAEVLSDVEFPKPPAFRVGISELPEKQYVQALQEKVKSPAKVLETVDGVNFADMTYADLTIKNLSREIAQELEFEEKEMLADLSLLWQGAAVQSDTINFALYKLANPDADKPDEKSLKNVLRTIASMSTLVGASMGSPVIAGSSLIGGNIFGIMSQDTKALNYKYTRVNDADMIILIRKVEDLQQRAVDLYYDYMSAKKQLEFVNKLVEDRQYKFELAQKNNASREMVVITDAYYRMALDRQRTARSEFYSKRAALEQFVGRETFLQFEAELAAREQGEVSSTDSSNVSKDVENSSSVQNAEYDKTVEAVTTFTDNLSNSENTEVNSVLTVDEDVFKDERVKDFELDSTGDITGLAVSLEDENPKTNIWSKLKRKNTDKSVEKVEKVKKVKPDPKSTKGFIFLHGEDKQTAIARYRNGDVTQYQAPIKEENSVKKNIFSFISGRKEEKSVDKNVKTKNTELNSKKDDYGFLPLDEIRVPELSKGGYSIHSENLY